MIPAYGLDLAHEVRAREIQSFTQDLEKTGPHYFKTQFPIFEYPAYEYDVTNTITNLDNHLT